MKIQQNQPTSRDAIYRSQSHFFAKCIRKLEVAADALFVGEYDPDAGEAAVFWAHPDYDIFHDAAYACGFVCNDLPPDFPIDEANLHPHERLGTETFKGLRHYVHTLLRAERSNRMDGYFSPVCKAIQSGALIVVAERLQSDESLYD